MAGLRCLTSPAGRRRAETENRKHVNGATPILEYVYCLKQSHLYNEQVEIPYEQMVEKAFQKRTNNVFNFS